MISEVDFISPCPVQGCIKNDTKYRWRHHNCGGYERITNQGKIYCLRCPTDGLFPDWLFNCGAHDFDYASAQGLSHALYIMSTLDTNNQLFIASLMRNTGEILMKKCKRN